MLTLYATSELDAPVRVFVQGLMQASGKIHPQPFSCAQTSRSCYVDLDGFLLSRDPDGNFSVGKPVQGHLAARQQGVQVSLSACVPGSGSHWI